MKRFGIVFVHEFRETLRSKPFRVISIFLAVLLILAAVGGLLLSGSLFSEDNFSGDIGDIHADSYVDYTDGGASDGNTITYFHSFAVDDRTGLGLTDRLREELPAYRMVEQSLNEESAAELIGSGEHDACVVILSPSEFEVYEETDMFGESYFGESVCKALETIARTDALTGLGLDPEQAREVLTGSSVWYTIHTVETESAGALNLGMYVYNYVVVILMFLVIGLYGQMVATRVATEKSSRTMEVLATSVSPVELLCGKVAGVGAAGLLQMLIFVLAAAGIIHGVMASSPRLSIVAEQLLSISAGDIACLVIYFVLGFALYAFIFGALGSMVSQIEDLSGTASMPLYFFMIGYFIGIFGSATGEPGMLAKVASFVPFWSPVTMFSRMSAQSVPVYELVISIALLALTAVFMAWLSARIYRSGMLRYGKPPRLKEIINAAREGK